MDKLKGPLSKVRLDSLRAAGFQELVAVICQIYHDEKMPRMLKGRLLILKIHELAKLAKTKREAHTRDLKKEREAG